MIFRENNIQSKNYNGIDICKFIMALLVVAIHTHPLEYCPNHIILNLYDLITDLAVPFFFLASGFLLANKLTYPYQSENDTYIIKKYLVKILKMYVLWTIIYSPLAVYDFISNGRGFLESVLLYVRGFLFVGEQYNSWQLWYLLSVVYGLILVLLLLKMKFTPKGILAVSIFFSIVILGVDVLVGSRGGSLPLMQMLVRYTIRDSRILNGIVYIPIGMYLAYKKIPRWINCFLLCGGFMINYFVDNFVIDHYMLIFSAIGFFGIVESLNLKDRFAYPFIRAMSMMIYLVHMYSWTFYYGLVYGEKTYGLDNFIATSLISCFIAGLYAIYLNKRRKGRKESAVSKEKKRGVPER